MSRDLTQRLTALSRAHDLVRPVLSEPKKAAPLADLLAVLLAPYDDKEPATEVRISVPELLVGEASATTLALSSTSWRRTRSIWSTLDGDRHNRRVMHGA